MYINLLVLSQYEVIMRQYDTGILDKVEQILIMVMSTIIIIKICIQIKMLYGNDTNHHHRASLLDSVNKLQDQRLKQAPQGRLSQSFNTTF